MNAVLCSCGILAARRCDKCSAALCESCALTWAHGQYGRFCAGCMPACEICGELAATRCKCSKLVCRKELVPVQRPDFLSRNTSDPLDSGYEFVCKECAFRILPLKAVPKVESSEEFLARFLRLMMEAGCPGIEDFYALGAGRFARPSARGWSFYKKSVPNPHERAGISSPYSITTDCALFLIHPMGRKRWRLSTHPFDYVMPEVREGAREAAGRLGVEID